MDIISIMLIILLLYTTTKARRTVLNNKKQVLIDIMIENTNYEDLLNQYLSIVESHTDAIITSDSTKCILSWNLGAEKIFGFNKNEVIGKPITLIIPDIYHERHDKGMNRLNDGKEPRTIGKVIEITALRKGGIEFPIELTLGYHSNKGKKYYSAIIRDISDKKELQNILDVQNQRFQVISRSKNDAIITSDESKRILSWSLGAEHMFGYTANEVINQPISLIIPANLRQAHNSGMDRMNQGGRPKVIDQVIELTAIKKNGEVFPIELTLGRWANNGKNYYSGIIRDITERKKAEETIRNQNEKILKEKELSDKLLKNILPNEIAEELKKNGKADAKLIEEVSILFTDFVSFTKVVARMNAFELVSELNVYFGAFDQIIEKYKIEKIKTIGDSYMAAGGLPIPTSDSIKNTVLAGLEMQKFISSRKIKNEAEGKPVFEMRVGIHTGPVVAGIVGMKKFQYDIWGDTVNTASRIESNSEAGKVNISHATYNLLQDDPQFTFESRGIIEAKGKGKVEMWFVQEGMKKE